ncbi:MAG: carboxypeptidase regulatory-like domain-containing protein, partial [Persicimonas sp.]
MGRRTQIGAVIVALVVVGLWWQFGQSDRQAEPDKEESRVEPFIEGRVVDSAGRPVEGARVETESGVGASTDEEGRFRLDGLKAGRHRLDARAEGFSSPGSADARRVEVTLSEEDGEPGIEDLELTLHRPARLSGRVVAGGDPVEGARIDLYYRSAAGLQGSLDPFVSSSGVETDEEGRFEVDRAAPGQLHLLVEADEYALAESREYRVEPGEELDDLMVDLDPASQVGGQVIDTEGDPVRARVVLRGEALERSRRVRTDDDGRFSFDDVPPGRVRLEARAPGFREERAEDITVESGERTATDLILEAADGVFGRVVDPDDEPVSEAVVILESSERSRPHVLRSDQEGRFQWDKAPDRRFSATAYSPKFAASEATGIRAGRDETLRLRPGGSVRGRVVGPDGEAVQSYSIGVEAVEADGPRPYRTRDVGVLEINDSGGRFAFDSLRPATYWFRAKSDRYADGTSERVEVRAERTTSGVTIRLGEAGRITGQVTDEESGEPVAGARVQLFEPGSPFSQNQTRTDEEGRYELDGVPSGRQSVRVTKKDYLATVEAGVEIDSVSRVRRDVEIRRQEDGERMQFQGIGAVLAKDDDGIFIRDALDGHPASEFGLKEGDYIKSVDGESVDGMRMSE